MGKKPETIEELRKDLRDHPGRGKINGAEISELRRVELRVPLAGYLYNRIILIRGALGLHKTEVTTIAMTDFLCKLRKIEAFDLTFDSQVPSGNSIFRGSVPVSTYRRCVQFGELHHLNAGQVGAIALSNFAFKEEIAIETEAFIQDKMREHKCDRETVLNALYGFSKKVSRQARLEEFEAGNKDIMQELKMDV